LIAVVQPPESAYDYEYKKEEGRDPEHPIEVDE
jgi:hypothetical protein